MVDELTIDEPMADDDRLDYVDDLAGFVDFRGDLDEDDLDEDDIADEDDSEVSESSDDDSDEDYVNPSDIEADLEEILRDRIAAGDDIEDDDDEEDLSELGLKDIRGVAPQRLGEWRCNQCFLIVSASQFGSQRSLICPSGEDPCESIYQVINR